LIDISTIIISDHAIKRFVERGEKMKQSFKDPKQTLIQFLSRSVLAEIDPKEKVRRIIEHNFEIADYYEYSGWRFVVVKKILVTVERIKNFQN